MSASHRHLPTYIGTQSKTIARQHHGVNGALDIIATEGEHQMIIDSLHHLHNASELWISIQSGQGASLIAHIGPQAGSICCVVECIFQIVVSLTPDQTQITYTLPWLLLLSVLIVIALHIGGRGRAASIVILILLLWIAIAIAIVGVAVDLCIQDLSTHKFHIVWETEVKSEKYLCLTCCVTSVRWIMTHESYSYTPGKSWLCMMISLPYQRPIICGRKRKDRERRVEFD